MFCGVPLRQPDAKGGWISLYLRRSLALTVLLTIVLTSSTTQDAVKTAAGAAGRTVPLEVNGQTLRWPARLWQGVLTRCA